MLQPELLKKVISVLNEHQIDYMVTGSFVSSIQGEPRASHDIDLVIQITTSSITRITESFPVPPYFISANAIREAIEHKSMFNLIDTAEGDKVDFWILTDEPFDLSRFSRKYYESFLGIKMKVSTPEDTILAKLRWAQLSGGSEKQFKDALRVYELQYEKLDNEYLDHWVKKINVSDLWNRLIKDSNPLIS